MFTFTNPATHHFQSGMIFLGRDPKTGREVGIGTERGAITIAGAGSGKNAALQVTNLLRWPHNVINIDPSGGNVAATYEAREAMGQRVVVFEPFRKNASIPDRLRVGCNLLGAIDPDDIDAREQIRVIADGLVMRHDPKHGEWAEARVDVIAGVMAHVISTAPPEHRTLADVRAALSLPSQSIDGKPSLLEALFTEMRDNPACGGLAQHGGNIGLTALASKGGDGPISKAVTGALSDTKWINAPAMASVLEGDFNLSELKTGNVSVFLVLPPEYLTEHGRFLRLFVLAALQAMMKGGAGGKPCLFMLDEFFSLGYMEIVEKAAGLMRKYGVILWPFLQDLGQLVKLYDPHGAQTFFGNSDAHIFFGNTDWETLTVISQSIGNLTTGEIGPTPTHFQGAPINGNLTRSMLSVGPQSQHIQQANAMIGGMVGAFGASLNALGQWAAQEEMARYQQKAAMVGRPRVPPETVRELVAKHNGDAVARSMIVFAKGGHILNLKLAPYFEKAASKKKSDKSPLVSEKWKYGSRLILSIYVSGVILFVLTRLIQEFVPQPTANLALIFLWGSVAWGVWDYLKQKWKRRRGAKSAPSS